MKITELSRGGFTKKQVFNPYLPLDTYIPDGEPHVFGDRIYIYGSHDKEGGDNWIESDIMNFNSTGKHPLYFEYTGTGKIDLLEIIFKEG